MTTAVTQMPSTRLPAHIYYADMADKLARDPVVEYQGRATVPMGRGFKTWKRMHPGEETVWVTNAEGQMYELTRSQANVLDISTSLSHQGRVTMRSLASELKVSPSTVSRAMVKLASFGLIAYLTGRGRYAGTLIIRRVSASDGLERFRIAAKAKVREWAKAAERRISRLEFNVAPYLLDRERGVDSLYYYLLSIPSTKSATLTAQLSREWTPDELADIR
jgi:predicted transcriptional regulator